MTPTEILVAACILIALLAGIVSYGIIWIKKPKNYLLIHQGRFKYSIRIKKMRATQPWKDPSDGRIINFPLDASYAYQTGKGALHFYGDPVTGLLTRFPEGTPDFEYMDPKYAPAALEDGRVLQIARAKQGDPAWLQYIPIALIIVGVLVAATLFMVYKMYSAAHTGT